MKKLYYILALLITIVLGACTDRIDLPGADENGNVPEGMVRLRITPGIIDQSIVATRGNVSPGVDEKNIKNCRVLVFDKNPNTDLDNTLLTQPPAAATWNATDGRLDVLLFEEPGVQRYICLVANLSSTNSNWLDTQDAGVGYVDIQQHLINILPVSGVIRIEPDALPLSGWMNGSVEIKKANGTVLNPTHSPLVTLTRSVARIDVDAASTHTLGEDFLITGVGVANCPQTGVHLPDIGGKLTAWGITHVAACDLQTQSAALTFKEKVYAFEHDGALGTPNEHPLRIVIKGKRHGSTTESFYGIDIVYVPDPNNAPDQKSMKIKRNYIYTIKLTKVRKDGYATYIEAARAASFNTTLDVDITVTDPYAHDIVTNGRQYLGVTNTEYVLYPYDDQASTNLVIASFTYTCDPIWMAGVITLPVGITLPIGAQQSLAVSPYAVQRDLVVNIAPTFTTGIITLHIGNLKKEIKVRRMIPTSATNSIYGNYYEGATIDIPNTEASFKEFKIGEVINFSAGTSWLKVGTTEDVSGEATLSNRVVTGVGGIYIHVANNIAYDTSSATPREASIYLAGDTQGERIRVHIQQPMADVYNNITKIEPFAYVGAFWQHNQTAERIIRMYGKQNKTTGEAEGVPGFWWQANVVAGQEWIVMDTNDPGVTPNGESVRRYTGGTTPNAYGTGDNANTQFGSDIEASITCQVNSKLRSVRGSGNYIYFRIGLTGKLNNATSIPRYGLIMISYGTTPNKIDGYHPIYIRQGEAADYLMRPFDPITRDPKLITANDQYPSRPNAVRMSPFNLDAPDNAVADPNDNSFKGFYALEVRGAAFAPYPSRAGSYFQGTKNFNTKRLDVYPPSTNVRPQAVENYTPAWDPTNDACPNGYRRIRDGDVNSQNIDGRIVGSEIRQSLMLFPAQGGDWNLPPTVQASLTNQYRGYLADGYFDRLQIVQSINASGLNQIMPYTIVKPDKAGQAHIGALFFNPNNYASVFLPFSGRWGGASGDKAEFQSRGSNTSFVSSTPSVGSFSSTAAWYLWVGNGFDYINKDFTSMYPSSSPVIPSSLRCVRDDNPIIETGGEIGNSGSGTSIDGINRDLNPNDDSNISARHHYVGSGTLQQQIEAEYTTVAKRKQIGSIVISGDAPLTAADYLYLNNWASDTNYTLRHITIHGNLTSGNTAIPTGAFTSSRWITIELRRNIKDIANGAFASSLVPGLKTLVIDYLDPINANPGIMGAFQFTTTGINLRLNGYELDQADIVNKSWKGLNWTGIRKNN